jgi:cytidylate kinase
MAKPSLINNPQKVTVYLPELVATRGRDIARQSGISLSQLMSDLLSGQASSISKVRVHADFPSDEYDTIKQVAHERGMSIEDLVRTATYTLLDTRPE